MTGKSKCGESLSVDTVQYCSGGGVESDRVIVASYQPDCGFIHVRPRRRLHHQKQKEGKDGSTRDDAWIHTIMNNKWISDF